jgi:hypothetical protein
LLGALSCYQADGSFRATLRVSGSLLVQGLVLDCSAMEFEPLDDFPEPLSGGLGAGGVPPLWLCLDEVMDPVSHG